MSSLNTDYGKRRDVLSILMNHGAPVTGVGRAREAWCNRVANKLVSVVLIFNQKLRYLDGSG